MAVNTCYLAGGEANSIMEFQNGIVGKNLIIMQNVREHADVYSFLTAQLASDMVTVDLLETEIR